MPKTRGTGLLMLWTDVDPEYEDEFNRWYDEEHIKRLTSVPGFLSGGRYVALKGGPKYLAMYELEEPNVLRTAAFLDEVRYKPSPWRAKTSGGHIGRNYLLQAYRQIYPGRTNPTVYEFERPDVSESEAWKRAAESNPWTARVRPQLMFDPGSPGVYKRIYPK